MFKIKYLIIVKNFIIKIFINIFILTIFYLYSILKTIVLNKNLQFVFKFWYKLNQYLNITLYILIIYYLEIDN